MKAFSLYVLLFVIPFAAFTQVSDTQNIQAFKKIEASNAVNIFYTQCDTFKLTVLAHEEDKKFIFATVKDSVLVVKLKGNLLHDYKINVFGNSLKKIACNGASKIASTNTLNTDSLSIDVSGVSNVSLKLNSKIIDVVLSDASKINLEGNTNSLYATISGASLLNAQAMNSSEVNISASGASSANLSVSKKIIANATESSAIKFKGEPMIVSVEASSSSVISKIDGNDKKPDNDSDSTTFSLGKKKFVIIDKEKNIIADSLLKNKRRFYHWTGFTFGVNGWLSDNSFSLPKGQNYMNLNYGKSFNLQLNPFEKNIHVYKNYINLVIGLGVEWNQYSFSNKTKLIADSSYTYGKIDTTNNYVYKKNKLKTTFINIPLLIEFNSSSNPQKAFHFAFGVIGGYKIGSRTRQVLEKNGDKTIVIRKDDYNINPFRLNSHVSLGYRNFTIFANYALTPLFQNRKGPTLYPFTLGVKLISF